MGSSLSEEQRKHVDELGYLLKKNNTEVPQRNLLRLVQEIAAQCLWYPEKGSLKLTDWERIGKTLHTEPRAKIEVLHVWHLCRHAIEKFGHNELSLLTPPPSRYTNAVICPPSSPEYMSSIPSAPADTGQKPPDSIVQSSFQKMVETCKRDASVSGTELAELLSVCPVQYHPGQGPQLGLQVAEWEGLPYQILRELKKAVTDYGISGNFTRGLVEGIKNGYTMIPEDWKQIFRMILTSMQYVVWESEYMRHAQAAALGGGGAYTVEQLFGSGPFGTIPTQVVLPPATLTIVSECAFRAFLKVPQAGEPRANFSNIRQNANEPYADFVERLSKAIRQQFDHQEAAGELLRQLAIENANADCKRALQPLKATAHYTLADMLRVCQDIGSQTYKMHMLAAAIQKGQRPIGNCFKCKKPGHFQKDCRSTPSMPQNRPSKKCPICKKGFHWANQCRFRSGNLPMGVAPTQNPKCAFPITLTPPAVSLTPPQPQPVALGSI